MEREPFLGGGPLQPDGKWSKPVPREIDEFRGVRTIEEYVDTVLRPTRVEAASRPLAAPSPLDLVASLDYLDAVWRATHHTHLFRYPSAEKTAKLSFPVNTRDELDARLSALGEILRTANSTAKNVARKKLQAASHREPLAPFGNYIGGIVGADAEPRVRAAVRDLERALALRDAAQHVEAGDRALEALDAFGIEHSVPDAQLAWTSITRRAIEALAVIREELNGVSG